MLNQLFPLTRRARQETKGLIAAIIIYVAAAAIASLILGLFYWIPAVGLVLKLVNWLIGVYCAAGIIVALLAFCGALK